MRKTLLFFGLILISSLFLSCVEEPVDWKKSFDSKDTTPYGTYVLRKELTTLFPNSEILNLTSNPIHFDWSNHPLDTYMYIDDKNRFNQKNWSLILNHVNNGGSALVSIGENIPLFERVLGVRVIQIPQNRTNLPLKINEVKTNLTKDFQSSYISEFNEEFTDVLGYSYIDKVLQPSFVKIYFGDGVLFLHTEPFVFTNYYLLKGDAMNYTSQVFSYFDDQNIIWDNHRIYSRYSNRDTDQNKDGFFAALSFILKNNGLREAFYLLLFMGILYLILNSRRRQAAVKIIAPYSNYNLNFAKTLSNLYKNNADHTALTRYKINYFLEQIRVHYNITSKDIEKDFTEILSTKSGVAWDTCEKLVRAIENLKSREYVSQKDFLILQSQIETFTIKSKNYGRK